jgi:hypothetical protein
MSSPNSYPLAASQRRPIFPPQTSGKPNHQEPNHQESTLSDEPLPSSTLDGNNTQGTIPVDADPLTMNHHIEFNGKAFGVEDGNFKAMIPKAKSTILTQARYDHNMDVFQDISHLSQLEKKDRIKELRKKHGTMGYSKNYNVKKQSSLQAQERRRAGSIASRFKPHEYFNELKSVHLSLSHRAQQTTFEKMKAEYNITRQVVGAYVDTCHICAEKSLHTPTKKSPI